MEMFNPSHPGIILLEDWIKPLGFTVKSFSLRIGVKEKDLSVIVKSQSGITAEIALKISKATGTTAQFWLNMQQQYDLWQAKQRVSLDDIEPIAIPN